MTEYVNVTLREYEEISEEILSVVRQPEVWQRRLGFTDVAGGYGVTQFTWYEQKDIGAIRVGMDAEGNDFDTGFISPTTQKIPVFWKDIYVSRRDLESSRNAPLTPIDLRAQKTLASKLTDKIEQAIGLGITAPFDVNPVNQDIQDGGSGLDWATVANIVIDTNANYATLLADAMYGAYYTIHYATLAATLKQLVGNTASIYEDYVNRVATLGTDYTLHTAINAGTQASGTDATQTMIQPSTNGQSNFTILRAQNWITEDLSAGRHGLRLKVYGAMIHEIFRTNAGSCVDGITDLAN